MNAYKFNLVRFAIGSVLVTGMVLFLTWLLALFGGGWPSWPRKKSPGPRVSTTSTSTS